MAVTYGYFNSINGDRKYNADQMSEYFDGLVSNGVYEDVGNAMQVLAAGGMNVNVQTGRAILNSKWVKNDAVLSLTLTGSHVTLNRYTAVVVRLDNVNRVITITTKDGTNAANPTKPTMTRTDNMFEICLAYIYVGAGVTSISQANITDTRLDNTVCGYVTGLIQQVDTSTLYLQWQTALENYFTNLQVQWDNWFDTLTQDLRVNTYIQKYYKRFVMGSTQSNIIPLNMTGYTYSASDIFEIYANGLYCSPDYDYLIDTSKTPVELHVNATATGSVIDIVVYKSKIGWNQLVDSNGNAIVTSDGSNLITEEGV